ncbi:MAG: hypothetical protein K2Q32_02810 [Alphaproteobacteria bacterium]|nr:hypothetical protein [Alphaproteobacteria bacterium]
MPEKLSERDPRIQQMPTQEETVRGDKDPPIVKLELGKTLRPANLRPTDELPSKVKIDSTNLNNAPVTAALQAVLADTDITLLWASQGLQDRKVTLMNLKGPLPIVVERICRSAKILCAYRNGALELSNEDTFVVQLPGVVASADGKNNAAASDAIAASIEALINGKVKADTVGGNLIYTTNAEGHERVQGYLNQVRNGRPLIVMQLYIWQVTLDDNKKLGISWKDLHLPSLGGSTQSLNIISDSHTQSVGNSEGVSLGAVLSGSVDVNLLAGFLATQGKVQTISSPQLTFVSGTSAKFEVGNKEKYVAQVGTTSSTVAGTGSTGTASQNVTTEELKTGLEISISGNYENGVVFSNLELKTSDLISFTNIPTNNTTLQLPKTADRKVSTVLRVRPGDNLVLAGLQTAREDRDREGLPGPDFVNGVIPTFGDRKINNSELVLMVKPSVVFFNEKESQDAHVTAGINPSYAIDENGKVDAGEKSDSAPLKSANTAPAQDKPNELQSEFGTVVKTYEDTYTAPVNSPVTTPVHNTPQNILPNNTAPDNSTNTSGATL